MQQATGLQNEVIALFPYEIADYQGNCESYMKVGQHASANYLHVIKQSRPATTEEFAELKQELAGYELKVIKRRNADRAMEAVRSKRCSPELTDAATETAYGFIQMILTGDDEGGRGGRS